MEVQTSVVLLCSFRFHSQMPTFLFIYLFILKNYFIVFPLLNSNTRIYIPGFEKQQLVNKVLY
jgi:hypothetical protein